MTKQYGEFQCPYCDEVFFIKKQLDGHIGGAHRRNITQDSKPKCKFCKEPLIKGKNWAEWAIKQRNLICTNCKRKQNRQSYRNRTKNRKTKLNTLKERLNAQRS